MNESDIQRIDRAAKWCAKRLPRALQQDLAQDLRQEACLSALRGRKSTIGPMLDALRAQGMIGLYRNQHLQYKRAAMPMLATPSHERTVIAMVDMERQLNTLTAKQREAIVLRYVEGYTEGEISRRLGVATAAVQQRQYEGIKKLRTMQ